MFQTVDEPMLGARMLSPYDTVNALINHKIPDRLFHYTTASGLFGIFTTKTLRATEASFLNDEAEILHAKEYMQNYIQNRMRKNPGILNNDGDDYLNILLRATHLEKPGVFVFSLSEERDLLSQWRAYAGGQDGYSIGFPAEKLKECAVNANFTLAKCAYDHQMKAQIASEIVEANIRKFEDSDKSKATSIAISRTVSDEIIKFGPLFKHDAFKEENEWRMFSPQIYIGDKRINFKISNERLVPYVNIEFTLDIANYSEDADDLIDLVVVEGPSQNYSQNGYATQAFLDSTFRHGIARGRSSAPYRTGK